MLLIFSICHDQCQLEINNVKTLTNELLAHYRSVVEATIVLPEPQHKLDEVYPKSWKKAHTFYTLGKLCDVRPNATFDVNPKDEEINMLKAWYRELLQCVKSTCGGTERILQNTFSRATPINFNFQKLIALRIDNLQSLQKFAFQSSMFNTNGICREKMIKL